eukprot:858141-Rhodomonas_salina.1
MALPPAANWAPAAGNLRNESPTDGSASSVDEGTGAPTGGGPSKTNSSGNTRQPDFLGGVSGGERAEAAL